MPFPALEVTSIETTEGETNWAILLTFAPVAPLSTLVGIENFLQIMAAITVVAIVLPLFDPQVRNMSYEDLSK